MITSDFRRSTSDERRQQPTDDADTEATQANGKERNDTEGILFSADVAFHLRKDDHHRIEDDGHSICN